MYQIYHARHGDWTDGGRQAGTISQSKMKIGSDKLLTDVVVVVDVRG